MPSDPSKPSSSSSSKPSSSSAKPSSPSSSSSAKPPSSSSSSSSKPNGDAKPPQPTPVISANAWMSFFLFCCLVLIILQAPLGLSGQGFGASTIFGLPALPWGAVPGAPVAGCAGMVAAYVPWCAPGFPVAYAQPMPQYQPPPLVVQSPPVMVEQRQVYEPKRNQMGGQGDVATPGGGAGWSWYANPDDSGYKREERPYRSVQYQRPGVQVQVTSGQPRTYQEQGIYSYPNPYYSSSLCSYFPYTPYYCSPLTFFVYAQPTDSRVYVPPPQGPVSPPVSMPVQPTALANLENAFYPLLIGAIALLVIFDYAS